MADNVQVTAGSGVAVASDEASYSGDTTQIQIVQLAFVTGSEGSRTLAKLPGDSTFGLTVRQKPAATATLANVAGSASSVTLIASNTARLGAVIVNDSAATCYLKYGSTASATSFTYLLQPGATWEMPVSAIYTGIITGLWSSATGNARCTELTS